MEHHLCQVLRSRRAGSARGRERRPPEELGVTWPWQVVATGG